MAEYKWRVNIIESERGWGQRIDEKKFFPTEQQAQAFFVEYNSQNTEEVVPDWYMYAERPQKVQVG